MAIYLIYIVNINHFLEDNTQSCSKKKQAIPKIFHANLK